MPANQPSPAFRLSDAVILLALSLGGCGGGDSTGPGDAFPSVAGTYSISGRFDGLTAEQGAFVGSLILEQPSQQSAALSGSLTITITSDGQVSALGSTPLQLAKVSQQGAVSFRTGSSVASWSFTGSVAGETISGRHNLAGPSAAFPGDWSATTGSQGTGSVIIVTSTSGSPLDPMATLFR
jgi:hypothetical protein